MEVVLRNDYYESTLRYENVDWFLNEVGKFKKMTFYIKNTKKDIVMTEDDEEDYRKNTFVDFVKKRLNLIK